MILPEKTMTTIIEGRKSLGFFEQMALVLLGSGLLVLSAKCMVPILNVPLTMQPLAAISLGLILGPRLAVLATLAYIFEGAMGLPVYADSLSYPGFAVFAKPSAGCIFSFPIAAFIAGSLAAKGWTESIFKATLLFVFSYAIIYTFGTLYLIQFVGVELGLQTMTAWIPADLAKIGIGVTATRLLSTK